MSYKLFIPGPIAVSEKTLRAMSQPMIGHRSTDFVALYNSIQPELQALAYTKDPVYLSTSSAWGASVDCRRCRYSAASCCNASARSAPNLRVTCVSGMYARNER